MSGLFEIPTAEVVVQDARQVNNVQKFIYRNILGTLIVGGRLPINVVDACCWL